MLRRFRTASPKLKIALGLWLFAELLSLPAAAAVALGLSSSPELLIAQPLDGTEPGHSQYLVTHRDGFDIVVAGTVQDLGIKIETATESEVGRSYCARLIGPTARTVATVREVEGETKDRSALIVTFSHPGRSEPTVSFEPLGALAPDALPCSAV